MFGHEKSYSSGDGPRLQRINRAGTPATRHLIVCHPHMAPVFDDRREQSEGRRPSNTLQLNPIWIVPGPGPPGQL